MIFRDWIQNGDEIVAMEYNKSYLKLLFIDKVIIIYTHYKYKKVKLLCVCKFTWSIKAIQYSRIEISTIINESICTIFQLKLTNNLDYWRCFYNVFHLYKYKKRQILVYRNVHKRCHCYFILRDWIQHGDIQYKCWILQYNLIKLID